MIESVVAEGLVEVGEKTLGFRILIEHSNCNLNQINVGAYWILAKGLIDSLKKAGEEISKVSLNESHNIFYEFDHSFNVHILIICFTPWLLKPAY